MSILFQSLISSKKIYTFHNSLKPLYLLCKCSSFRKYSDVPKKFVSFDDINAQRRLEARRSLVVQVNSESSYSELYSYCTNYSNINGIHHYKNNGGEHFMLIEFTTEDDLKNVLHNCGCYRKDINVMVSQSPFVWFRAVPRKREKHTEAPAKFLMTTNGTQQINEETLFEELRQCNTVSDQIQTLYERTKLNDLGYRLRYMVARHIEVIFDSLCANVVVRPFGSSVNGFGKMGSDLDLVLTNVVTDEMSDSQKRLVYQEKRWNGSRGGPLELAATLLETRAAGVDRVTRVLHARVPIVKFHHQLATLDCDLCYSNMSGVYMSELVRAVGGWAGGQTRALAAAVRGWARAAGLTSASPGRWVTGFPLTLMVLFFLQQPRNNKRLLPTVNELVANAGKEDIRITEDNINCTFLRDLSKLLPNTYGQTTESLEALLLQFFEFYAQFDFQNKAISINEGTAIRKPNSQPLYIVNPLEQSLNVSRNVSYEECVKLQTEVRNAAWQLEAELERNKSDDWGILGLIEPKTIKGLKKLLRVGNTHRLVSVKDLFNDQGENGTDLTEKSEVIKKNIPVRREIFRFKNRQVASEVNRIRRNKML